MAGMFERLLSDQRYKVAEAQGLEVHYLPAKEVRFSQHHPITAHTYRLYQIYGHPHDMGIDNVPVSAVQVGDMVLATLGGGCEDLLHEVLREVEEGHEHVEDHCPWITRPRLRRW